MATLHLSCVTSTAQQVSRTPALIARATEGYFWARIQTEGEGGVLKIERAGRLAPGDFGPYASARYASTRPYPMRFDGPLQPYRWCCPARQRRAADLPAAVSHVAFAHGRPPAPRMT